MLFVYVLFIFFTYTNKGLSLKHSRQFFLDTADESVWATYYKMGIYHGITTNPVLLDRAKVPCEIKSLKKLSETAIKKYNVECFMLQTWGTDVITLVNNGLELFSLSDKIVVKIPLTSIGIEAAAILKSKSVPICMTACYTPHQVFTSIGLNADYVAPYLGRMLDLGKNGIEDIITMQQMVQQMGSNTRVFVASIRDTDQLVKLAAAGCSTFTFSPNIAQALQEVPETITATEEFESAVLRSQTHY